MSPKYFKRPDCPDRTFFACSRLHGDVSVEWCAQTWREVNCRKKAHRWGESRETIRDRTCKQCPLGAQHAGVDFVPPAVVVDSKVCPRCRRSSDRLIFGRLCVSCYNRDRERKIGRNAKGAAPKRLLPLYRVHVLARVKDDPPIVRDDVCVDGTEAVIAAFRALGPFAAIGFSAKRKQLQSDLFEGL